VFLIHTQSKTAIALTGFSMLVGGAFVAYNPRYRSLVLPGFVIAAAVTAYAASIYVPHFLRELAQSQDAFTGRVQIWRVLAAYIRDNPIWGCGYMSFWDVGPISPVNDYIARSWVNTSVGEGHNGYLDLWAQIGLPGLLLTLLCVVAWPIGQLLMSRTAPRAAGGMWLAIMVFVVAQNFTESTIMSPDQFTQLALMLALANMRALSGTSLPGRDVRLPSYRSRVAPAARGSADPASRPAAR
jgi:O-antigen ligase